MAIFLVTFCVMILVVVGMSVGVLLGGKPITGSCGGVGNALGENDYVCDMCGGDEAKCEELKQEGFSGSAAQNTEADLAVDVSRKSSSES